MKYPMYPKMKDSGIEWLGKIPEHWELKKIKWMSQVVRGQSPRPIEDPKYFNENGRFGWVRISDVTKAGMYLDKTEQTLSELGASMSVKLYPGELFLSIAGSVGKPCIANIPCCIHDGFVYMPKLAEDKKFIYYNFIAGECYKGLGKLGTQLNLNRDIVGDIKLPIPPYKEQKNIVTFLIQETTRIDKLINKKEKLIELLQEKRQALISHAVTKGLNPDVPTKDSGVEWLGEIPDHWEIKPIKYLCGINLKNLSANTHDKQKITYVDISSVDSNGKLSDLATMTFKEAPSRARRIISPGDTIISTVRTYLKAVAFFEKSSKGLICSTGFAVLTSKKFVCSKFLYYWVRSTQFINAVVAHSVGVSYPAINSSELKMLISLLPPIKEQQEIVEYLEQEAIKKIDKLLGKINEQITNLVEYKQALISNVVTGKIDVRGIN